MGILLLRRLLDAMCRFDVQPGPHHGDVIVQIVVIVMRRSARSPSGVSAGRHRHLLSTHRRVIAEKGDDNPCRQGRYSGTKAGSVAGKTQGRCGVRGGVAGLCHRCVCRVYSLHEPEEPRRSLGVESQITLSLRFNPHRNGSATSERGASEPALKPGQLCVGWEMA